MGLNSKILQTLKTLVEADVSPLFRHLDVYTVVVIAIMSGVAEKFSSEASYRRNLDFWIASGVFGLAHIWKKQRTVYGIYAAFMGLVFGGIHICSEHLWVPILAHVVNNFVAILYYIHHILAPPTSSMAKVR